MEQSTQDRRLFLQQTLAGLLSGAALTNIAAAEDKKPAAAPATSAATGPSAGPAKGAHDNHILRMTDDLKRAMAKPKDQRRWAMVIDRRKCVGCHGCTINCATENGLPPGIFYRPVDDQMSGSYPNLKQVFTPRPCNQCGNPPCVPVCPVEPVKATQLGSDGVVTINYDLCIGCGACVDACPYKARTLDEGKFFTKNVGLNGMQPYEQRNTFEYLTKRNRSKDEPPMDKARKCHFCLHRLENGMLPACTTTCIGHATYFGDMNDAGSLVKELITGASKVTKLKEELGTKPNVYYLD